MKEWLSKNYKNILCIVFCVLYYFFLFVLCRSFNIDFDDYDAENNIKIAKFYFITLPIASALPVILYELIKLIRSKSK